MFAKSDVEKRQAGYARMKKAHSSKGSLSGPPRRVPQCHRLQRIRSKLAISSCEQLQAGLGCDAFVVVVVDDH